MNNELVTFETAKLLKQKGFHWWHVTKLPSREALLAPSPEHPAKVEGKGVYDQALGHNHCYNEEGQEIRPKYYSPRNPHYPRPTQALVMRWLRETFDIHLVVFPGFGYPTWFVWSVRTRDEQIDTVDLDLNLSYETYELALEAAIQEALKLLPDEQRTEESMAGQPPGGG